jgi:hypothetical protein
LERASWLAPLAMLFAAAGASLGSGCSTVEPGDDFDIAEVVFDENYYYCKIEPMMFAKGCGSGDPNPESGCHFNVTALRLTDYAPLVGDSCGGGVVPGLPPTSAARNNYTVTQAQMRLDPNTAPLLLYPTDQASAHPRKMFDLQSPEADLIRDWATKFSTQ